MTGRDHEGPPFGIRLAQDLQDRRLDAGAVRLHVDVDGDAGELPQNLGESGYPQAQAAVRKCVSVVGAEVVPGVGLAKLIDSEPGMHVALESGTGDEVVAGMRHLRSRKRVVAHLY